MTTVLRASVRLDEDDLAFITQLKQPDAVEYDAFAALTGKDAAHSPAGTIVNALVEAGMEAVRQRAEQMRYARLAAHLATDAEHHAWRASRSSRNAQRSLGAT